jgi:hypothetical protein
VDHGLSTDHGDEHPAVGGCAVGSVPGICRRGSSGLGTAGSYSVLGGQTVTNTGPSTLSGDLGVSPGTAITGFPPGTVGGATHAGDARPPRLNPTSRSPTTAPPVALRPPASPEIWSDRH